MALCRSCNGLGSYEFWGRYHKCPVCGGSGDDGEPDPYEEYDKLCEEVEDHLRSFTMDDLSTILTSYQINIHIDTAFNIFKEWLDNELDRAFESYAYETDADINHERLLEYIVNEFVEYLSKISES